VIALVLLAAMAPMALAATVDSITVSVPEIKDLQMTLTKVQDKYSHEPFMFDQSQTPYFFYFEKGGTVTFSKKVTLSFVDLSTYATSTKDFEANVPVTVDDSFSGGSLYFDDAAKGFVGFISKEDSVRGSGASACSLDINELKVSSAAPEPAPLPAPEPAPEPAPAPAPAKATAVPSPQKITVNGADVAFDAYNINGNNYFKLRDLAKALDGSAKQFEVDWDGEKNAITLTSGKAYTPVGDELAAGDGKNKEALSSTAKVYLDGEELSLTAYNINGYNYFKLRDLGQAIDFGVDYDAATNTVIIDTSIGYSA
jgi:hypothetical protein